MSVEYFFLGFWIGCGIAFAVMAVCGWFTEYAGPSQAAPGPHPYEAKTDRPGPPRQFGATPIPAPDPTDALFDTSPEGLKRHRLDWPDTTEPFWVPEYLDSKAIH